jgi:serine/threonine-protein kinase SRPK3
MSDSETNSETNSDTSDYSSDEQVNNLDLKGKILKNYNIISELGRGAYSIVWLGFNINDNKYYAMKVNDPDEYEEGEHELSLLKRIEPNKNICDLKEYFIEKRDNLKFICSVFELHCCDLDELIDNNFENGLPEEMVDHIYKQLKVALNYLHNDLRVFHGDIKPENILLKGISNKVQHIIDYYNNENFLQKYNTEKKRFWVANGKSLEKINKMKKEDKLKIRIHVHQKIIDNYKKPDNISREIPYQYIKKLDISLTDFGSFCPDEDVYDAEFGTVYYNAPEVILLGDSTNKVDVWSLGCTLYELLTGNVLFKPRENKDGNENYNHLLKMCHECGEFNINFLKGTQKYKSYFNKKGKLNNLSNLKELGDEKKLDDLNYYWKNIISKCLDLYPHNRYSINQLNQM